MNVVRRVASNIAYLFACQVASRLLGLALNLVLARRLADSGYGRYSLILVIVSIAGMAADFGTASILVREVSRRRVNSSSLLGATLLLRLATTVFVSAGVITVLLTAGIGRSLAVPLIIATVAIIPTSLSTACEAALQGFERMGLSSVADVVFSVVLTAVGVAVVVRGGGVTAMTGAYLVASFVRLMYSASAYRWLVGSLEGAGGSWRFDYGRLRMLAGESFPVLYWQLVSFAYYKVDMLMLGALRTEAEVGWYAAAYKLFEVPVMFGWLAVQSLVPLMSRMFYESKQNLALLFGKAMKYIWVVGLGATGGIAVLTPTVIRLLLPPEYEPAVNVLMVLGVSLPFMVGCVLFGSLFISMEVQRRMAKWSLVSLAVNVGLNLLLIPHFGVMGAAVTTLFSELVSFVISYAFAAYFLGHIRFREVFLMPMLAAAPAFIVMFLLAGYSTPVAGVAGAAIFLAALMLLRVVSQDDLVYFRRLKEGGS